MPEFSATLITAEANDYSITPSSPVTFLAPGDVEPITFTVTDDSDVEGDEILTLTLSDPSCPNNGNLGDDYLLTIRIEDNDSKCVKIIK